MTTLSSELAAHLDIKFKFFGHKWSNSGQNDERYFEIERLRIEHVSECRFSLGLSTISSNMLGLDPL